MQNYRIYFILVVVIVLLFFLFYCFMINKKSNKFEKKFNSFALHTKAESKSILDIFDNIFWKIIEVFNKLFSKSKLFDYHSKDFEKYVNYYDNDRKNGSDILTIKILLSIIVFISSFIFSVLDIAPLNYIFIVLLSIFSYFIPNLILEIKYSTTSKNVASDLLTAIIIINQSLQNGSNINEAIDSVVNELDGTISDEFYRISKDLEYGLCLSEAFSRFDTRVKLDSTKLILTTLEVFEQTDNNLIDIFSYIERELEDSNNLTNELLRSTSSSRFIYKLVFILPFMIFAFFSIFYVDLMVELFINPTGFFIFIAIVSLYILFIISIKLVMQVDL